MAEGKSTSEVDVPSQLVGQEKEGNKALKKQRGIIKGRFTFKVRLLNDLVLQDSPMEVLEAAYKEILVLFDKLENVNVQILQECSDEQSQHLDYLWDLQKLQYECHSKIVRLKEKHKGQRNVSNNAKCDIQIKKVEPPIFHGDVRDFPTFVKDYDRLVVSPHGKDSFILRQSLQGKAREAVGRLNEYDDMWTRLKDRFGLSAKVVDAVWVIFVH